MANPKGISAEELRDYLSRQIKRLLLLRRILIALVIVVVISVIGHVIYYFNHLTDLNYDVVTALAKVESAIQYRANLVPVLIDCVASFITHEDRVFKRTVDARERSLKVDQQVLKDLQEAANQPMGEILQKIMAIAEQYPDLKISETYQLLMREVNNTEMEIYKQRLDYNDKVNIYTTAIKMFPGNFYATVFFDFPSYEYFKGSYQSEWPQVTALTKNYDVSREDRER